MILGQRSSKFGIPRVNQYPVPPNATPQQKLAEKSANGPGYKPVPKPQSPAYSQVNHAGQRAGNGSQGQAGGQGQQKPGGGAGGQVGGQGQHHPQVTGGFSGYDPNKPLGPPTQQPGGVQVDPNSPFQIQPFPRGAGQIPANDPYWTNVAQLLFNAQQSYNSSNLQSGYAKDDQQTQLAQMAVNRYQQQQGDVGDAMRNGLAYSGSLSKLDAQHGLDYSNSVDNTTKQYGRDEFQRGQDRGNLVQGFGLDVSRQQSDAVARLAQAQADRAHTGAPAITPAEIARIKRLLNGGGKGHGGKGHK